MDLKEEKTRIEIEAKELQIKIQRSKEEQQNLMQELIKKAGQLELLAKFELTAGVSDKEQENNSQISEDKNE